MKTGFTQRGQVLIILLGTMFLGGGAATAFIQGNSVKDVRKAVSEAAYRARAGHGPTFLNCRVYRYYGHSMSDTCKYRTRKEEEQWKTKDPIYIAADKLLQTSGWNEKRLSQIKEEVMVEMTEAVKFAQESPVPTEDDLFTNVYYS